MYELIWRYDFCIKRYRHICKICRGIGMAFFEGCLENLFCKQFITPSIQYWNTKYVAFRLQIMIHPNQNFAYATTIDLLWPDWIVSIEIRAKINFTLIQLNSVKAISHMVYELVNHLWNGFDYTRWNVILHLYITAPSTVSQTWGDCGNRWGENNR